VYRRQKKPACHQTPRSKKLGKPYSLVGGRHKSGKKPKTLGEMTLTSVGGVKLSSLNKGPGHSGRKPIKIKKLLESAVREKESPKLQNTFTDP